MITCAILLGSSRILAIAANKDVRNGSLSSIQIESEVARDCISHGCITNVEQAAMHLRSLIQKLGNRMRTPISAAYVGVGGMSLHSLEQLPSVQLPDYDVLGSEQIADGKYQLTIGRKSIQQRTKAAMERAGIRIIEVVALPQATSTILTRNEREQGCVLVDMGAGTTTVSIFKDDDLRHLAVIPLGGDVVTHDIMSAGCSYDEAERIKIEWSNVAPDASSASNPFADNALPFPLSKLNNIALCRYEEIAANIEHQIELSGLKGQLAAGCILTGGAAMQSGLTSLLRQTLTVSRIATRAYSEPALLGSERKPHLTNALGLLSLCAEDCQAAPAAPVAASPAAATPAAPARKADANPNEPTLDLPDAEDDPTPAVDSSETGDQHTLRSSVSRFFKDLIS